MFVLGPDASNTKSDMVTNKSKTASKNEDYTTATLENHNKAPFEEVKPEEQDAEKDENPYEEGSTRNRIKNDPATIIETEDTIDVSTESSEEHQDHFPGYNTEEEEA
jgi:hypothetical protein